MMKLQPQQLIVSMMLAMPGFSAQAAADEPLPTLDWRLSGGTWRVTGAERNGYAAGNSELSFELPFHQVPVFVGFGYQASRSELFNSEPETDTFEGGNFLLRVGFYSKRLRLWTGVSGGSYRHYLRDLDQPFSEVSADKYLQYGGMLGASFNILDGSVGSILLFAELHQQNLTYHQREASVRLRSHDLVATSASYGLVFALKIEPDNTPRSYGTMNFHYHNYSWGGCNCGFFDVTARIAAKATEALLQAAVAGVLRNI